MAASMKSLLVHLMKKKLQQDQEEKSKINKNQIKYKQIKPKLKPQQPVNTKKKDFDQRNKVMLTNKN